MALYYLWCVVVFIQSFFALGTAYRLTKRGGDNGLALWGWLFVLGLASLVPGLGIYLWTKYKDDSEYSTKFKQNSGTASAYPSSSQWSGN